MAEQKRVVEEDPRTQAIREYLDRQDTEKFLKKQGATGCGIGRDANNEACLNLYVDKDRPNVNKRERPKIRVSHGGQSFDVNVREVPAGEFRLDSGGAPPSEPPLHVAGGVGISTSTLATGTLGGWAWDNPRDCLVFLSNFHVIGDTGVEVFCPPASNHRLGTTRQGQRILNGKPKVDCAKGDVDQPKRAVLEVVGLGAAILETGTPRSGARVVKFGLGSCETQGTIGDPDFTNSILIKTLGGLMMYPVANCFTIVPDPGTVWAKPRDSGSLVLSAVPDAHGVREVIGIHFLSGNVDGQDVGIACSIDNVFKALSISTLSGGILDTLVASAVGDGKPATDMKKVLNGFRTRCATSAAGQRILDVIDKNRNGLVTLLATDTELRKNAAEMLGDVFANAGTVAAAMKKPKTAETVGKIREFGTTLAGAATDLQDRIDKGGKGGTAGRDLRAAIEACLDDIPLAPDPTTTLDDIVQPGQSVRAGAHGL